MPNPLNLAQGAVDQARHEMVYARVSSTKPLPATFNDPLFVFFPTWQPQNFWRIDHWPRIHGNTLPAANAECIVTKHPSGTYRCLWWDGLNT